MKVQHIAIEGKCFFINADMIIRRSSYPSDLQGYNIVSELPGLVCRGGSCIIDPYGHYLTKPVWDKETIIYAEPDMNLPAACKCICYSISLTASCSGLRTFFLVTSASPSAVISTNVVWIGSFERKYRNSFNKTSSFFSSS